MSAARRLGEYELLGPLGTGGMGQVWEARHAGLPGRRLALKQATGLGSPEDRLRFRREAELLARVHHPGVVAVHAVGEAPGGPWLVMDLVEGESLEGLLHRGPLPVGVAVRLIARLGEALSALHREGIVHRDLKPQNVLLRADGTPVLVDFGLAWAGDVQRLTHTGALLGTPAYMAPELIKDASRVDPRVDVYGLGALLFALVCGRGPFPGQGLVTILHRVLHDPPDWPAAGAPGSELPAPVRRAIEAALEKDPARRPARVEELLALLRRDASPAPRIGLGPTLAVTGLLALVATGLLAQLLARPDAPAPAPAPGPAPAAAPPPAPEPEPAQPALGALRRLRRGDWVGGRFAGGALVLWNEQSLRRVSATDESEWSLPLQGSVGWVQPLPDGTLAWTESTAGGSRVAVARGGQAMWDQSFPARRVAGFAAWPDARTLAVALEDERSSPRQGDLLLLDGQSGVTRATARVPHAGARHTVGEISGGAGRLMVIQANSSVDALIKVVPWSLAGGALTNGVTWQLDFSYELETLCADPDWVWVGDIDGRIHRLDAAGGDAASDRIYELISEDLPARQEGNVRAGAHPPGFRVRQLRRAGPYLWSLASRKRGASEVRCWDVSGPEPRLVTCLSGLPPATLDLDPAGETLLVVLPSEGAWLVSAASLREGPVEWSQLRERARREDR